jgi:hypothetical protein
MVLGKMQLNGDEIFGIIHSCFEGEFRTKTVATLCINPLFHYWGQNAVV